MDLSFLQRLRTPPPEVLAVFLHAFPKRDETWYRRLPGRADLLD